MSERFLVPVDGSEQSFKALELASRLAGDSDAEIEVLHVVPKRSLPKGLEEWAKAEHVEEATDLLYEKTVGEGILQSAKARLGDRAHLRQRIEHGDPAEKILEVALEDNATSIVMGTQGLTRFKGLVMGSTAQKVSLSAPCPVLSVKT